jgi:hypothetical protein
MLNPEKQVQGKLVSARASRFWRPCGQSNLLFITLTGKTLMLNYYNKVNSPDLFQHLFFKI